jgi:hypothetical protein
MRFLGAAIIEDVYVNVKIAASGIRTIWNFKPLLPATPLN